jgi:hypothetical protein
MMNLFKTLEIHFWNLLLPIGKRGHERKEAIAPPLSAPDEVRLEYLVQSAQQVIDPEPIRSILSQQSREVDLSSQPTTKIENREKQSSIYLGTTVPTKAIKQKIKQGEAFMLVVSSVLGLVIGILIAFFVK